MSYWPIYIQGIVMHIKCLNTAFIGQFFPNQKEERKKLSGFERKEPEETITLVARKLCWIVIWTKEHWIIFGKRPRFKCWKNVLFTIGFLFLSSFCNYVIFHQRHDSCLLGYSFRMHIENKFLWKGVNTFIRVAYNNDI